MADLSSGATIADSKGSQSKIAESALAWLQKDRRISRATLAKLPVASGTAYFPDLQRKSSAVYFRYPDGWKARAYPEKAFTQKVGTKPTFWNLDAVLDALANDKCEDVRIVEGELDVCALVESGIDEHTILSVPSASPVDPEGKGLEYVNDALKAGLSKAKRFIWCGDQDEKGLAMRATMARMLGVGRFYYIDWPEPTKDANDHLRTDGVQAVYDLVVDGPLPWPTIGLFKLSEIPEAPPMTTWSIGFLNGDGDVERPWNDRLKLAPGTLTVVTGHPGMGKTLLWGQLWYQVAKQYDLMICVASFETRPKPHIRRQLRTLHGRRLEEYLGPEEIREADHWIDEHYRFLVHPERRPDLQWLLEQAEQAVIRHRIRVLQVDPWNRLEAAREPRETETEYIGRCLRACYNFAVDFGVHLQIVAHPSKTESLRRGMPSELEDIAGSKHWDNMVDQGFVVYRPQLFDESGQRQTYVELHHKKARFDELGYATKVALNYDISMGRFGLCELRKKQKGSKRKDEGGNDE